MNTNQNTNETINQNQDSPTLRGVLWGKFVDHAKAHKMGQLTRQGVELVAGLVVGAAIIAPHQMSELGSYILTVGDYVIPRVVLVTGLFFTRKKIMKAYKRFKRHAETQEAIENEEALIDGIPVNELVDYMVRNKKFKREGVNGVRTTFGLSMEKFNRLAKKLEEMDVLVRAENNGRVLNTKWSRQALVDYLSGEEKSEDLAPRITIRKINNDGKMRLMAAEIKGV